MRGDLLRKLALVIKEVEKSHDKPSASWRPWGVNSERYLKVSEPREPDGITLSLRSKS
jgi:hypothetical protein